MSFVITVDGLSASGKSVLAKGLSSKLGFSYLNTGKIYRLLAREVMNYNIPLNDVESIKSLAASFDIGFINNSTVLYDEDTAAVASKVAAIPDVRYSLLKVQRSFACKGLVADGRDTGSVVFKDADYKFYVVANLNVRAKRRISDSSKDNYNNLLSKTMMLLKERDDRDMNRSVAPLIVPENAFIFDTTYLDIDEVVDLALCSIKNKI